MKSFIHSISLPASTTAMYSASMVDNATVFCNLDCHETSPPAYVITYPDVDPLVSVKVILEFKLLDTRRIYGMENSYLEGKNTNQDLVDKSK